MSLCWSAQVWFPRELSPSRTTPLGIWDSTSTLRSGAETHERPALLELRIRLRKVSRWVDAVFAGRAASRRKQEERPLQTAHATAGLVFSAGKRDKAM